MVSAGQAHFPIAGAPRRGFCRHFPAGEEKLTRKGKCSLAIRFFKDANPKSPNVPSISFGESGCKYHEARGPGQ